MRRATLQGQGLTRSTGRRRGGGVLAKASFRDGRWLHWSVPAAPHKGEDREWQLNSETK
jgi:hypothetical protein